MSLWSIRMRAEEAERHISGAESIVFEEEIPEKAEAFIKRALNHSRGRPDTIYVTIEELKQTPLYISSIPVYTVKLQSHADAWNFIRKALQRLGVSADAVQKAEEIIHTEQMRGASLLTAITARRVEPDTRRGVRATRLGITKETEERLNRILDEMGVNRTVVKEALILASKVASTPSVIAEICVSDDPHYTTGYLSSPRVGYIRIPMIKERGSLKGGRVFFVKENCNLKETVEYLERTPVMINRLGEFHGEVEPEDVITLCGC
jgi:6-carboxyhexanoate--CoA ligase